MLFDTSALSSLGSPGCLGNADALRSQCSHKNIHVAMVQLTEDGRMLNVMLQTKIMFLHTISYDGVNTKVL